MKTILKQLSFVLLALSVLTISGCKSSDPETENALAGTWECHITLTEDDVTMIGKVIETYSLPDHEFQTEINFYLTYPMTIQICKITYSGQWKATKEYLYQDIEKNSISFTFNNSVLDSSDREGMKSQFLKELSDQGYSEGIRFKSPISDSFKAEDDEGEIYEYIRVN